MMAKILCGHGLSVGGSSVDFFADSVNGDDASGGTTAATAFETLAKLQAVTTVLGNGTLVDLVRGSSWEESLNLSSLENVRVRGIGSGALPISDGASTVTAWTAEGTANVWQATVSHNSSANARCIVFEDGAIMTRVADAATCSATPGSFVDLQGSDGTPWTVKIHPTGSGDPTANGSLYEVTQRLYGVTAGDNSSVYDLEVTRCLAPNGGIDLVNQPNSAVARVVSSFCGKHNIGIGSGNVTDSLAVFSDPPVSYDPTNNLFVAYVDDARTLSATFTRCFAIDDDQTSAVIGFYAHGAAPPNDYFGTVTMDQCAAYGLTVAFSAQATNRIIQNSFCQRTLSCIGGKGETVTVRRCIFDLSGVNSVFALSQITKLSVAAGLSISFEDCVFYSSNGSSIEMLRFSENGTYSFTNCVLATGASRPKMIKTAGWTGGSMTINNSIFYGAGNWMMDIPTGVTYTGDNNVWMNPSATTLPLRYQNTVTTTLAAWQSATGQDANSVAYTSADADDLWSGVIANGDFRLNSTGAGAAAAAISAGVQNYWDWDQRAIVSGQPSAWPIIPQSIADARTYALSPSSWAFSA